MCIRLNLISLANLSPVDLIIWPIKTTREGKGNFSPSPQVKQAFKWKRTTTKIDKILIKSRAAFLCNYKEGPISSLLSDDHRALAFFKSLSDTGGVRPQAQACSTHLQVVTEKTTDSCLPETREAEHSPFRI